MLGTLLLVACGWSLSLVRGQLPTNVAAFVNSTLMLVEAPANFTTSNATCFAMGNGALAPASTSPLMELITQPLRDVRFTRIGGIQAVVELWAWLPSATIGLTPLLMFVGGNCLQESCPWGVGSPSLTDGCVATNATTWISVDCDVPMPFTCEVPYAVLYFCFNAQVPTEYNLALQVCLNANGTLASIPTLASWSVILQSTNCGMLGTARVGASNYDRGTFESSRPYEFRWNGAFLGQEDGGRGRLFSTGVAPATPVGYATLPWSEGQPVVTTENVVAVSMPEATLFPLTFRLAREAGTWFVCETPAPGFSADLNPGRSTTPPPAPPSDTPYLIGVIVSSVGIVVIAIVFFALYKAYRPLVVRDRYHRSSSDSRRRSTVSRRRSSSHHHHRHSSTDRRRSSVHHSKQHR